MTFQKSQENPIDKTSVYVAAGLISAAGALLLNVLPVLFGTLAEAFGLGEAELGNLAFSANIGFALLGIISLAWVRKTSWRTISIIASAVVTLAILYIWTKPSYGGLLAAMAVAGAGTGALYALAMVIFGDSSQPERAYGFKLGMETLPGVVLLVLLPVVIAPAWGFGGVMITLALAAVLMGIVPLPWVPARGLDRSGDASPTHDHVPHGSASTTVWLSLLASLIFLMGIIAIWAFLELIGKQTGLSSDTIGMVLSAGFFVNAIGGFIAAGLGLKVGRITPVVIVIAAELLGLVLIGQFASVTTFAVGVMLFLFSINFVLAYTFGLMAEYDLSGKLVALGSVCLSLGGALGPMISGNIIESSGYTAALVFSGGCSLVALAIYASLARRASQLTLAPSQP
ncbi:hypothetical protein JJB09_05410 [Rhizobium sp. KVB221]|uniref:Major facilitator superfamily (MFS) profile domain-containing protein n=1 Tax=Rhizobium setariae TaxID=2801340 RepID=A0A936YJG4_9HYPH|nr:MFS transporter [Rhizobium setariae]MBL0371459.1 hypothetical protein [Rhizobium setariae]